MKKRKLFRNFSFNGRMLGLFLFVCYFIAAKSQLYIKDSTKIIIKGKAIIYEGNNGKEKYDDTLKTQRKQPSNIIYVVKGTILSGISECDNIQVVTLEDRSSVIKYKKDYVVKKTVSFKNSNGGQILAKATPKLILSYKPNSFYFKAPFLYSIISIPVQNGKDYTTERSFWSSTEYLILLFLTIFFIPECICCNNYVNNFNKTRPPPKSHILFC